MDQPLYQAVTLNSLKDCFKDLSFDLYLLMPTGKYLKAFDRATGLDFARLTAYEAKGVKHFYILLEDFPRLNDYLSRSPMMTLTNPSAPFETRKTAFLAVMEQSLFEAFNMGAPSQMNLARTAEALKHSLQSDRDFLDTLQILLEVCPRDDAFLKHAIQTSIYTYIVAKTNDMTSERSLKILLFASFFHDFGKLALPETRRMVYQNKSLEEIIEFRSHPALTLEGFKMPLPFADEEIRSCILQHKERIDGKGFPHGVKGPSIFSLARILAIGDSISELTLGMEDGNFYSKPQALAHMLADEGHYDKILLMTFEKSILQSSHGQEAA